MLTSRLTLISHAPTAATRAASFAIDDDDLLAPVPPIGLRAGTFLTGPERRCRRTAEGLGFAATVEPPLADLDVAAWRGRTLTEVDQADLALWLTDPAATPHGGESVESLIARVGAWLETVEGRTVAVTHAAVVRAALVHALAAPPRSFWRIDVSPLSRTALSRSGPSWTVSSVNLAVGSGPSSS
ncbi:histidine phosphatase family protein [Fodinicola acaciae]|uniref:histidine phosphatase family protein n=1 Tax=Fodinicola acaciae TaxID=2681555 RepID=UPI0013D4F009